LNIGQDIGGIKFFHLETDLHIKFRLAPLFDGKKHFSLLSWNTKAGFA
jgi:hypothetical protein